MRRPYFEPTLSKQQRQGLQARRYFSWCKTAYSCTCSRPSCHRVTYVFLIRAPSIKYVSYTNEARSIPDFYMICTTCIYHTLASPECNEDFSKGNRVFMSRRQLFRVGRMRLPAESGWVRLLEKRHALARSLEEKKSTSPVPQFEPAVPFWRPKIKVLDVRSQIVALQLLNRLCMFGG